MFNDCGFDNKTGLTHLTEFKIENERWHGYVGPSFMYFTTYEFTGDGIFPSCPFYVEKDVVINNDFYWDTSGILFIKNECLPFTYTCGKNYETDTKFIPLKIDRGNNVYFGWLQMALASDSIIFRNYAYKTIPHNFILAGQKE